MHVMTLTPRSLACAILFTAFSGAAWAQSNDDAQTDQAGDSAPGGETAATELPELTGQASGTADGVPFSGKVDCSAFGEADMVRALSDPGGAVGEDLSGDGFFLDVMASRNTGSIELNLTVNNTSYNFSGRLAQVQAQVLSYAVTLKSASGPDISITLKVDCSA